MQRWFRLALLLTVLSVCAILATRLIGGTRASALAPLFTMPDRSPCEHPCLFGVQPGYVSVDAAAAILSAHPALKGYETMRTGTRAGTRLHLENPAGLTVDLYGTADGQVDAISIGQHLSIQTIGSLGDIVSRFSAPSNILIDKASEMMVSFEQANLITKGRHMVDNTSSDGDRLHLGDVVQLVVVFRLFDCVHYPALVKLMTSSWRGFTPIARYQKSADIELSSRYLLLGDIAVPCRA